MSLQPSRTSFLCPRSIGKLTQMNILRTTGFTPSAKAGAGIGKLNVFHLKPIMSRIPDIVRTIPFPGTSRVFTIGDYGAADGGSSVSILRELISKLKEHHGQDIQIQIIYEDQEINDFNALFRNIAGLNPDLHSYFLEYDNVYPLASGVQFYRQCVPSDSMNLILAMLCAQWFSKLPVLYKHSVHIYPVSTPEEKEARLIQASKDWQQFLLLRSKELKPGGLLTLSLPSERLDSTGQTRITGHTLIHALNETWMFFKNSGRITSEEFLKTNFAYWAFPLNQLRENFDDPGSVISQSGLVLLWAEVHTIEFDHYRAWRDKKKMEGIDDRKTFAKEYVNARRNWSESTFLCGLSNSRSYQERKDIVDHLFEEVEEKISKIDPEIIHCDGFFNYLCIQKKT